MALKLSRRANRKATRVRAVESQSWLTRWALRISSSEPCHGAKCAQPRTRSGKKHINRIARVTDDCERRQQIPDAAPTRCQYFAARPHSRGKHHVYGIGSCSRRQHPQGDHRIRCVQCHGELPFTIKSDMSANKTTKKTAIAAPAEPSPSSSYESRYSPAEIEPRWQKRWAEQPDLYGAEPATSGKPKYYVIEMLPYPSGQLHMGHVRNYAIGDALARYMWMTGHNVLHPMGWDAFGLPAENAALKNNTPPRQWTLANVAAMRKQMRRMGLSYDWSKEVATCLPDYYCWNQWFFLKFFERGLAYRKKSKVNWCPKCCTVLA